MKPIRVNLLETHEPSTRGLWLLGLVLLAAAAVITGLNIVAYQRNQGLITAAEHRLKSLKAAAPRPYTLDSDTMTTIRGDAAFLNAVIKADAFPWIDVINALESAMTPAITLTDVTASQSAITLVGSSPSAGPMSGFIKALDRTVLAVETLSQEQNAGTITFQMTLRIHHVPAG